MSELTKQSKMTALAISIASYVHENQLDQGGNAYILHPLRVMQRLRTQDQELMQIAVMHDVREDITKEKFLELGFKYDEFNIDDLDNRNHLSFLVGVNLRELGFSQRVTTALQSLNHYKDESYGDYIERILRNIDAINVKIEDIRDNSDITRLKGVRKKDLQRMVKYHHAYLRLIHARENWQR